MHLNKYFKVLGLQPGASEIEIRKQYRKLAMRYHPDKNPDSDTRKQFDLVQEAYEVLTGKKNIPLPSAKSVKRHNPQKSKEDRIREARRRYYEQQQREKAENERFYRGLFKGRNWLIIRISAVIGTILACAIALEWFIPPHVELDQVHSFSYGITTFDDTHVLSVLKTNSGRYLWVTENKSMLERIGEIQIRTSWVFHDPINCAYLEGLTPQIIDLKLTFYSFGYVFAIVFLLPLVTYLFPRRTSAYTFLYYVTLYLSPLCILVFFLSKDHWAHLLSLGYL
jgi:hypothetical protein